MFGITWLLVWLGMFLNLLPKEGYHQKQKWDPKGSPKWKRKLRTLPQYLRPRVLKGMLKSRYYDLCIIAKHHKYIHYVILPAVVVIVFIIALPLTNIGMASLYSLSLLALGSAVQPYEILGTGVVEASEFGNGNDIPAIQEAIDYARMNGKPCIYVGPGTWTGGINDNLTFDGVSSTWEGLTVIGAGRKNTILNFNTLNGKSALDFTQGGGHNIDTVNIGEMKIIGNANANYGIRFDTTTYVSLNNLLIVDFTKNLYGGIGYISIYNGTITNVRTYNCFYGQHLSTSNALVFIGGSFSSGSYGIRVDGGYRLSFIGITAQDNNNHGVHLRTGNNCIVQDSYFEDNGMSHVRFSSTDQGRSKKSKIVHCYFQGGSVTPNGVHVERSEACTIEDNMFWNHTANSIYLANTLGSQKTYDTTVRNNWTDSDPNFIYIDSNNYRTIIQQNIEYLDLITDNGFFTITEDRIVVTYINSGVGELCGGYMAAIDLTDTSGKSIESSSTINEKDIVGVVYDGAIDTLGATANAGQKDIIVADIWAWFGHDGRTIRLVDDAGNTETKVIDTINTSTNTITVTVNLVNTYTAANNTHILLSFITNEPCNIIRYGNAQYLRVDGNTDIAAGDYISNFSTSGVGWKGYDNFIAIAIESYTGDNNNGFIAAELITPTPSLKLEATFVHGTGTAATNVKGWDVNAAGEGGSGFIKLPPTVTKCVRMEVLASSRSANANHMMLNITVYAGADNEDEGIHMQSYVYPSDTVNFAVNDILTWSILSGVVTDDVTGGDNIRVWAQQNNAVGGDIATSIYLRNFVVYCI